MAINELTAVLKQMRELVLDCHRKVKDSKESDVIRDTYREFELVYGDELKQIADELRGQINTANRPYTIAMVGEFDVGKTAVLNAILGLTGDASLPEHDTPTTAVSTLVLPCNENEPEARIRFTDNSTEDTTWLEAKKLVNQLWLNEHPEQNSKAEKIVEIEYRISSPILQSVIFNDLPGTGSKYWRVHTELTHRKMKEADGIFWVIGEDEPSMDAKRDLMILKECSKSVIPIMNVIEDPTHEPPIERDDKRYDDIEDTLRKEFSSYFRQDIEKPIRLSAHVAQQEIAKENPEASILEETGYHQLINQIQNITVYSSGKDSARASRIVGAAEHLAKVAQKNTKRIGHNAKDWRTKFEQDVEERVLNIEDLDDILYEAGMKVKDIADMTSYKICEFYTTQAEVFIGDTLQISNLPDLTKTIKKGKQEASRVLMESFENGYILSNIDWLDSIGESYQKDVIRIVTPLWKRFVRSVQTRTDAKAELTGPVYNMDNITDSLIQGFTEILQRIGGILAVAGLLVIIPGGAIIDAVGIVGFIILSAIKDPFEGRRNRMIQRVTGQIMVQRYGISNNLQELSEKLNHKIRDDIKDDLETKRDINRECSDIMHSLMENCSDTTERLANLLMALNEIGSA